MGDVPMIAATSPAAGTALGAAAIAALGALVVGLLNFSTQRSALQNQDRQLEESRRQLQVALEGQITDRFTQAIEQIGSKNMDVRVGAIYSLKGLAAHQSADHTAIVEVLAAYVRQHSPWPPTATDEDEATENGTVDRLLEAMPLTRRAADVQAAMTVLGRHMDASRYVETLELSNVDLRGADLRDCKLSRVDFRSANLEDAHLEHVDLSKAQLQKATFLGARLKYANLREAQFKDADLSGAMIDRADLREAGLQGARLQKVHCYYSRLQEANFLEADLQEAEMGYAVMEKAIFTDAILRGAILKKAHLQGGNFRGADLREADLSRAELQGADFWDASLEDTNFTGAKADPSTIWPPSFDAEARESRGIEESGTIGSVKAAEA